ncbi:serine hydrolase [Agromyces sp. LHK192]|uniref:serine hydrolase domain-containing protein n=1 Tax=Agromyces sp. LHK192 TaxID=2498704 RepID=UPI000FD86F98|nr:serine hydrolase domain-containing protein [Agromyces sp. LHK192]
MTDIQTAGPAVSGTCDDRYAGLRDEFARRVENGDELGASVAVYEGDDLVVDLWGGWADPERTAPWQRDTITNVWSISKTATALAALVLVDRGLLDPDAPVAEYWPEFAAAGKEGVLVKHVLMHTSGVSGWAQPVDAATILDLERAAALLAAQPAWWPAGTMSGYHLLDFGHLVGELVRRVDGRTLGAFVREELADPLSADLWLGLPESEEPRVSLVVPPPPSQIDFAAMPPESPAFRTFTGPALGAEITWTREWRAAGIGGAGGQGNARGAARLNSVLANGGVAGGRRILAPETVDRVFAEHTDGIDLVLGIPLRFGLGWAVPNPSSPEAMPDGRIAYWGGWGGSLVVADADRGVTFAYVMNRMSPGIIGSERSTAYLAEVSRAAS